MLREILLKDMKITSEKRKQQLQINKPIVIGKASFSLKKSTENRILHASFWVNSCLHHKRTEAQLIDQIRQKYSTR